MSYISNTATDRAEMLEAIGVSTFDELLAPIPGAIRFEGLLDLPPALDEHGLLRHLGHLAGKNVNLESHLCFLGAGIYDHFRPSVVGAMMSAKIATVMNTESVFTGAWNSAAKVRLAAQQIANITKVEKTSAVGSTGTSFKKPSAKAAASKVAT